MGALELQLEFLEPKYLELHKNIEALRISEDPIPAELLRQYAMFRDAYQQTLREMKTRDPPRTIYSPKVA